MVQEEKLVLRFGPGACKTSFARLQTKSTRRPISVTSRRGPCASLLGPPSCKNVEVVIQNLRNPSWKRTRPIVAQPSRGNVLWAEMENWAQIVLGELATSLGCRRMVGAT